MSNIKNQLVSQSIVNSKSYGTGNGKKSVTVHQTGNTSKGAGAKAHANLQSNGNTRQASWHVSVDDKEAIRSFENDVMCWHAGDGRGPGNTTSIAVELCINSDADYKKTLENGAKVVKQLLDEIGSNQVEQHHKWDGKNCPAQLRAVQGGISWADFLNMVNGEAVQVSKPTPSKPKPTPIKPKQVTGKVADIQRTLNSRYNLNIAVDNLYGPETKRALVRALQTELNKQTNARLVVDGIFGAKTRNACINVRQGARGNITWILQAILHCKGFVPGAIDGIFEVRTRNAVRNFQRANSLVTDGIAGAQTFQVLFK